MKASFSVSASITAPGTYSSNSSSINGLLIWDGDGSMDRDDVAAALGKLDERYATARKEIEAGLLEDIAAAERSAAKVAESR